MYQLTALVTLSSNSLNSDEDLFISCWVKFCCNLNPKLIFGSDGGTVFVVAGGPTVVIVGGTDVPSTGGELVLPRK